MKTEEIAKLAVSLSLEAQGFEKKMSSINKSIKNAERDFKSAGKGIEGFEKSFTGLDAKIKKTEKQLDLYNKKLIEQKDQYKKVQSDLVATKNKLDELEKTQGKNSDAWKEQAQLVQKNAQDLNKLSTDINTTESNISKLTNELNNAQKEFNELGNKTKTLDEKLEDISREANLTQSEFDKLGNELNENGTYFQKLGNEMNKLSAEITAGVNKIDAYENEIDKLSDTLNKQKSEYSQLESKIQTYSQHLDRASSMYGENSSQANEYRQKLLQLKDSYNNLENEITQGYNALDKYQAELNQTQTEVNDLSNELKNMPFDKIGTSLKDAGNDLKSVGQSMTTAVTLPIAAAGTAATKASLDFESAFTGVVKTVDMTTSEMAAMEEGIRNLSKEMPTAATEIAAVAEAAGQLGIEKENILSFSKTMVQLGDTTNLSADEAATSMARLANITGMSQNDFDKLGSTVVALGNNMATTEADIVAMGMRLAGAGSQVGMTEAQIMSFAAALSSVGIEAEAGGSAFSKVMIDMKLAVEKGGNSLKNFSKVAGMSSSEFKKAYETDATGAIMKFIEGLGNAESKGQSAIGILDKMGISEVRLRDTLLRAAGASSTFSEAINIGTQAWEENNALTKEAETRYATNASKLEIMKNKIMDAAVTIGDNLMPIVLTCAEGIAQLSENFSNMDEEAQKNIITIAGIAAAIGPLLMIVGQILIVGGNTVTLLGAIKSGGLSAAGSFGMLQKAIALVSGPAGIVALVGILISLISKLGENENKLTDLQEKWGVLGEVIGSVCEHISGTVQLTLDNVGILISTLGKTIMAIISGDFKSIDEIWSQGWAKIENNTAKASSNINQESSRGIALLREMTERELNNLTNTLEIALQKLPELTADNASEMANTFVTRMQGLDQDTLTILRGTSDTMAVLFEGIKANMSDDEAHKKFTANLESMAKSGEFTTDKISQDISNAMNLIDQNVMDGSGRVKNSAQEMFDGIASISQFGMDSAVNNIVSSVNNMSNETIQSLAAMGGHWEALFGGIALTGKDAVADMDSHIRGRLQELASSSPGFIAEMEAQMSQHFSNINQEGTSNANELSTNVENALSKTEQSLNTHTKNAANNVEVNTKSAANSAKTNMNNAATEVGKAASNMAIEAKKGTSQVAQNTDIDMKQANKSVQQSATDMYNGAKNSYSKLKDCAKQDMTDMYKGTKTSAEKAASSAKNAASDMYRGVTTSTKKMADKAIADWNRIRNTYSKSINGNVKVTKTTVNRTEAANLAFTDNESNLFLNLAKVQTNDILDTLSISKKYKTKDSNYSINNNSRSILSLSNELNNEKYEKKYEEIFQQLSNQNNLIEKLIDVVAYYINKDIEIPIILDGREVARGIAPYKNELDNYDGRNPKFSY